MIEISEKTIRELEEPRITGAPEMMSRRALVQFTDGVTLGLGSDVKGDSFAVIADCMMSGHYYPDEIIRFEGQFRRDRRDLRVGDRVLQLARLPFLPGYRTRTVVEISFAERSESRCKIGYYTTSRHFAKGWWQATLSLESGELTLLVECQAQPQSLVYWFAIPVARRMQLRAMNAAMLRFASWM